MARLVLDSAGNQKFVPLWLGFGFGSVAVPLFVRGCRGSENRAGQLENRLPGDRPVGGSHPIETWPSTHWLCANFPKYRDEAGPEFAMNCDEKYGKSWRETAEHLFQG